MAQAMLRLLASPNTTATRPSRFSMGEVLLQISPDDRTEYQPPRSTSWTEGMARPRKRSPSARNLLTESVAKKLHSEALFCAAATGKSAATHAAIDSAESTIRMVEGTSSANSGR